MASLTRGVGQEAQGFSAPATSAGNPVNQFSSSATGNLISSLGKVAEGGIELAEDNLADGIAEETSQAIQQLTADLFGNPDDPVLRRTQDRASALETARDRKSISETRYQLERVRLQRRLSNQHPGYSEDIRKIFKSAGGDPGDSLATAMIKEQTAVTEHERKQVEADLTFARDSNLTVYDQSNRVDEEATLYSVTRVRSQLRLEQEAAVDAGEAMTDVLNGKASGVGVHPVAAGAIQTMSRNSQARIQRSLTALTNVYRQAVSSGDSDAVDAARNLRQDIQLELSSLVANQKSQTFVNRQGQTVSYNTAHKKYVDDQFSWVDSYSSMLTAFPEKVDQEALSRLENQNKILTSNLEANMPLSTKMIGVYTKHLGDAVGLKVAEGGGLLDRVIKDQAELMVSLDSFVAGQGPMPSSDTKTGATAFRVLQRQLEAVKGGFVISDKGQGTGGEGASVKDTTAATIALFGTTMESLGADPKNTEAMSKLIIDKQFQEKMLTSVPEADRPAIVKEMGNTLMRSAQDMFKDFNDLPNRNDYSLTQDPDGSVRFRIKPDAPTPSSPFAIASPTTSGAGQILKENERRKAQAQVNKLNTRLQEIKQFGSFWIKDKTASEAFWEAARQQVGFSPTQPENLSEGVDMEVNSILSQAVGLEDNDLVTKTVTPDVLDSLVQIESGGDPDAVSSSGAVGVAQILPSTAAKPGFGLPSLDLENSTAAEQKIWAGKYLSKLAGRYDDNLTYALAAYNWGIGNVDRWVKAGAEFSKLPKETQNYLRKFKKEGVDVEVDNG